MLDKTVKMPTLKRFSDLMRKPMTDRLTYAAAAGLRMTVNVS